MLLFKLGYRNLWRNRRRTLLTMSAMSLATTLLILTLGIYDGMLWDMIIWLRVYSSEASRAGLKSHPW